MPPIGSRKRVIALVAENSNQVLKCSSAGPGYELSLLGYQPHIIDLAAPGGIQELESTLKLNDTAFAYGFAGVGAQLNKGNVNLWTSARIPFVAFWYDHPAYNFRQHMVSSPYILHVYHIRDHYEVRRKYLPSVSSAIMLPPLMPPPTKQSVSWKTAERAFLFVKTGHDPAEIEKKWQTYPPILRDMLHGLAEQAKRDRNLDLADATAEIFKQGNHPLDDLDNFFGVMQEVDHYIRSWRSDKLARALLVHPAKIIGGGWDYLADQTRRAQILPPFPAYELAGRMRGNRLIANSSPLWRDGIHERACIGLIAANVVLSDRTEKSDNILKDLPNFVGFDWNDDLGDAIATAWSRSGDHEDYYDATENVLNEFLTTSKNNFTHPLEQAVSNLYGTR